MPKLRAGSEAAADLLASDSIEEWTRAYQSYDQSVRRLSQEKGRAGLVEADQWWRADLPAILRSRGAEPYLTKEELVKVVQWKLWMGVVRPNLLRFANESDPGKVKMRSREAFCHLPRPHPSETEHRSETDGATPRASPTATRKAVSALTSDLKGVGPATASAILSAVCGDCPFDADEVIDAVMKTGVRKYSLNEYLEVQEVLAAKADLLGNPWNAERVRKAIWSRAMHSRFGLDPPAEGTSLSGNRGACPSRKERTAGRHDAGTRAEEGNGLRSRRKSSNVGGINEGGNGNIAKRRKSRR